VNGYDTVFTVYDGLWPLLGHTLLFWALGIAVLIGSIVWIRRLRIVKFWNKQEGLKPGSLLLFSTVWLLITIPGFSYRLWLAYQLESIYRHDNATVVEGTVRFLHRQPASGHARGDMI